jgi:hypothetical protein
VEHYAFLFFLRAFALRAAAAAKAADAASLRPTPPPPPPLAHRAAALAAALRSIIALPTRQRVLYALKLTAACVGASLLGNLSSGSGQWAAIAVQIVGARDGVLMGGPCRAAAQRVVGTAAGVLFVSALLAAAGAAGAASVAPLLAPMAAWAALSGLVRATPAYAYGAMVSSYTPYIIAFDPASEAGRAFAYRRIEQNLIGLAIFAAVEVCVAPQRAAPALRAALSAALRAAAAAAEAAWAPALAPHARCPGCAAAAAAAAAAAVDALAAAIVRQRALLASAADEPRLSWFSPVAAQRAAAWQRLIDTHQTRLCSLLSLMALAAAADDADADGAAAAALRRMAAPVAPALAALRDALCALLSGLAADVDAGSALAGAHSAAACRADAAAARVDEALEVVEARYGAAVVRLRVSHGLSADAGGAIPPSAAVLPLHALMLCTRHLAAAARAVARGVRELLPPPPPGRACAGDGGAEEEHAEDTDTCFTNDSAYVAPAEAPAAAAAAGESPDDGKEGPADDGMQAACAACAACAALSAAQTG